MNKEEILARSQKENKNGDEREKQVQDKANAVGAAAGVLLCVLILMVEEIFFDRSTTAVLLIFTGMEFATSTTAYIQGKKKSWLVVSVLFGVLVLLYTAYYLLEILGVNW